MQTHPVRAPARHPPRRSRLRYRGAVSLQRGPGWTVPWRLPREEAAPYLPEGGLGRAAMPSGVRVSCAPTAPRSSAATRPIPRPG
ncbi:hypothetical protein [Streptomyces melanosporofaciens]|uniref:hypothetical protein n=1 Tax=Streptomyces melanosporofaciens TaxID=67327 RepID=UPI003139FFEF